MRIYVAANREGGGVSTQFSVQTASSNIPTYEDSPSLAQQKKSFGHGCCCLGGRRVCSISSPFLHLYDGAGVQRLIVEWVVQWCIFVTLNLDSGSCKFQHHVTSSPGYILYVNVNIKYNSCCVSMRGKVYFSQITTFKNFTACNSHNYINRPGWREKLASESGQKGFKVNEM